MEVRIKQGEEMIDATIEMVDGVMVVSPKEFEPKDGDVVTINQGNQIFILQKHLTAIHGHCYCGWNFKKDELYNSGFYNYNRLATEEEKQKLFDRLAEKGYSWDAERKELVKLKWKPKVYEIFYYPFFEGLKAVVRCISYMSEEDIDEDEEIQSGKVFKTEQECQEFCDKLNQAINQVKP